MPRFVISVNKNRVPFIETTPETALYQKIVELSRAPQFYKDFEIADTLWARFEVLALHLSIYLVNTPHSQRKALVNLFVDDLDASVRELTAKDLSVGKYVTQFVRSFYGRLFIYTQVFRDKDKQALQNLIGRSHFNLPQHLETKLADYALNFHASLKPHKRGQHD